MRAVGRLLLLFGVTTVYTALLSLACLFVRAESRPQFRARHQTTGSRLLCRIFRLRVRTTGALPYDQTLLIVCNHFGILDPFVLASTLPVAFVGKAEIARWPFFGWVARTYGVIFVDRDKQHAVSNFVQQVQNRMRSRVPVLVFPEGTTSADESVLPFKTGAFAAVSGMADGEILPVYLRPVEIGGRAVSEQNRRLVTWAGGNEPFTTNLLRITGLRSMAMEVCVGKPFRVGDMNRKALADEAYDRVVALRDAGSKRTLHSSRA